MGERKKEEESDKEKDVCRGRERREGGGESDVSKGREREKESESV